MAVNFERMGQVIKDLGGRRVAVAGAADVDALVSVIQAKELGIAHPVLVGDAYGIRQIAERLELDLNGCRIVDCKDEVQSCHEAVRLIRVDEADALMKGLVTTANTLKAALNRETGIRDADLLSHVGMFESDVLGRPIFITDAALPILPDVATKQLIIENAVKMLRVLGYEKPKVGCVCALETVNPKMPATVDAAELVKLGADRDDYDIGGPYALDNAVLEQAARLKGVDDPVAGKADILLMPNIEAGNIFYKALTFLTGLPGAGLIVGAKAPIIVTSRADHDVAKLHSIILALYLAHKNKTED